MRHRVYFVLLVTLIFALPSFADSAHFGPVSLSDDNSGGFIATASSSTVGNTLTISLPDYSTSGNCSLGFCFGPNSVNIGLTVSSLSPIESITYTYTGLFTGSGFANFEQDGNAFVNSGTFSGSTYSNTFYFAGVTSVNLTTLLSLDDELDTAAVSEVKFSVTTPEPASITLLAIGALACLRRKRTSLGS